MQEDERSGGYIYKNVRRRKPDSLLRTQYYYRQGQVKLIPVDNSALGIVQPAGKYVFVLRFSKRQRKFLVETIEGRRFWTDHLQCVRPEVEGYELSNTSFRQLAKMNYREGDWVCYRTSGQYAYLKETHNQVAMDQKDFQIFRDGVFNCEGIPRGYNYLLGYADSKNGELGSDDVFLYNNYNNVVLSAMLQNEKFNSENAAEE